MSDTQELEYDADFCSEAHAVPVLAEGEGALARLLSPAWVPIGRRFLDAERHQCMSRAATEVARVLSIVLGLRSDLVILDGRHRPNLAEAAFGLELDWEGSRLLLSLDLGAARMLSDRIGERFAGLCGSGSLTGAECGMLEFVSLSVLDRLAGGSPRPEAGKVLVSFVDTLAAEKVTRECGLLPLALKLCVGARWGSVWLWVPAAWALECTDGLPSPQHPHRTTLSLRLPAIDIDPSTIAELVPGDAILLGGTSVDSLARFGRLVSDHGWDLGRIESVVDRADHLEIHTPPFDPRPLPPLLDSGKLIPEFVGSPLDGAELINHLRRTPIVLSKDLEAPIRLVANARLEFRAELLRLPDDSLAARILEKGVRRCN